MKTASNHGSLGVLSLGALGVVFGDIGTSPIYALRQSLDTSGTTVYDIYGVVSLIFWSLMLVVSLKYLAFVLRADNNGEVSRGPDGKAFTVSFEILGENYIALNGGPQFTFNEAFSIFVSCDGQAEVDKYWDAFINAGGSESRCGWLKDKFGLSWQIIPKQLGEALSNPDALKSQASMAAMMKMSKIIISDL